MCLSAGAETRHLPGQSRLATRAAKETSGALRSQSANTHTYLGTPTDNREALLSHLRAPNKRMPALACHSSCCRLAQCAAKENRSQCGDRGDWSSSAGLTQSCLLPERCGSGTLHRWKTEEGEWVIMRVLAPFCPHTHTHKKRAQPTTMALLPACRVWFFETVITEFWR